jgi:uncharacterized membrane protein HdeD (DUF308 family)
MLGVGWVAMEIPDERAAHATGVGTRADEASAIPPPPRPIEYQDVDTAGWWLSILAGLALVAVGIWLLTNPFRSVVVLAVLVGVSLIVGGVAEVVALGGRDDLGWLAWIAGALVAAAGIAVLVWPDITLWALAALAGAGLVAAGLLRAATAFTRQGHADWPVQLALAGVTVAVGAVVLAWPDATIVVLAVLLGLRAIGTGLVAIGLGWQSHRLTT